MPGSLIVGPYDLLSYDSPATLLGFAGTDFGTGAPDTKTVSRILLDGDVVAGTRTGNRLLKLVVLVHSDLNNAQVIADLTSAVNQQAWTIAWTPDTGKPTVVFDCYRGQITRDWDQYLEAVTLTLIIPALPFTRDAALTSLNPTTPAGIVTLNSCDSTSGLTTALGWVNTQNAQYISGPSNGPNYYYYEPTMGGDTPPAVLTLDTAAKVAGTGSVRIFQPTSLIERTYGSTYSGTNYAPFMVQGTIAATDLSRSQFISWSAKYDVGNQLQTSAFAGIGVNPLQADGNTPVSGSWAMTLIDSAGRRSTWTLYQQPSAGFAQFTLDITAPAFTGDSGFDITAVTGYRLRFYMAGGEGQDAGSSPELYPDANASAFQNLVGCTWTSAKPQVFTTANGTIEWSWGSTVPVTAGQVYSGFSSVIVVYPGPPTGRTFQIGIEWLDSTSAVLSTTWSVVGSARSEPVFNRDNTITGYEYLAELPVSGATAPTGATQARIRARVLGAQGSAGSPSTSDQYTLAAPHIIAGSTAYRYLYGNTIPGFYLWLDDIRALPAGAGALLTTSYAQTMFTGVLGSARTPISIAVNAVGGARPNRLLIARTPKPASAFTPFLDTPSSSGSSTSDSTALSGKNWFLNPGATGNVYTLPAWAYGSTYVVLARLKRTASGTPASPLVTAQVGSDATNTTSCTCTWGASAADVAAFPLNTWSLLTLGVLTLPPKGVSPQNTTQTMTVAVVAPTSTQGFYVDMLVLVDLAGEMLLIDQPTGTPWYWMDAAGQATFTGTVLAGTSPDRTDALSVSAYQSGQAVLNFDPGTNALTVLMDQSNTGGTVAVSYYPRWSGERPDHVVPPPPTGVYPAVYPATY